MGRRAWVRHALAIAVTAIGCLAGAQSAAAVAPVVTITAAQAEGGVTDDTTPPETTIIDGPSEGEVINSDAPAFSWASSESFSTFTCTTDGVPIASCELAYITGAGNGRHTFTVAATDRAGNTDPTPATRTFTIRLTGAPPNVARCQVDGRVVIATNGNDTRVGTRGTDLMYGLGGNDLLRGIDGADCLAGGSGDDRLFAGSGNDYVFGNTGTDRLAGEAGNDELYGNAGNDRITGGSGRDLLDGSTGNDHISDAVGRDTFSGGPGNDRVDARDRSRAGRFVPDVVKCGTGRFDIAIVDRRDSVARDCERVRRR